MELITNETNLDYLITPLRLHIGDYEDEFTYTDAFLRTHLVYAVKALGPRWNYKYLIDADNAVSRNPHRAYLFASPPIIEYSDERAIILQAAIDIKSPIVYTRSMTTVQWKDEEVSYSNTVGHTALADSLKKDLEELESLFPPPRKRLAQPKKQSLPGFENPPNQYEG